MNNREPHEEGNLARLIRAGFDPAARPDPSTGQRTFQQVQAAWRAEYGGGARGAEQTKPSQPDAEKPLAEPPISAVRREQTEHERNTKHERNGIMSKLFWRWGLGLGAAACAATIMLVIFSSTHKAQATAAEVMAKGAQAVANLRSIHLRGQMRTDPAGNLSSIRPDAPPVPIELWKQFWPDWRWRVEKSGRVEVMDGQATVLLLRPKNFAFKSGVDEAKSDAWWLLRVADLSQTITNELQNMLARGWKVSVARSQGGDGRMKSVVTIHARSNLPDNDYLKNSTMDLSDTRWVYRFDETTGLLESVQAYLITKAGEVLIVEISEIEYRPIDPGVFQLQLPANVAWATKLEKLPDNEKYASMTAQEAARAFFEACGREDWVEAAKFMMLPLDDEAKEYLGGLQIISLGQPVTSAAGPAAGPIMVPYEIKLKAGKVLKHMLGLGKSRSLDRWLIKGGL
jgi:hypothetical protein